MSGTVARRGAAPACAIAMLALGGCTRVLDHKGYVVDSALINSIAPGVDNRDSVTKTLGRPSFASEFDRGATWYYLSRETRQFAFANPAPSQQVLLAVRFAPSGDVSSVQKTGVETVRSVSPYGPKTPTRGRSRGFFAELFGNIGTTGAGTGGPTTDNPDN